MPKPLAGATSSRHADVVVAGGGVIGSSIALHLRQRLPGARIMVVERDPTYARAAVDRFETGALYVNGAMI